MIGAQHRHRSKYSRADVDQWIDLARRYLKSDGRIPSTMIEIISEMSTQDHRLTFLFFHELRRYPKLRKYLMMSDMDPDDTGGDFSFLDHPAAGKKREANRADLMFR